MPGFSVRRRSMRRGTPTRLSALLGAVFVLGGGCEVLISDPGLDILFPGGSVQIDDSGVNVQAPGVSVVVETDSN